MFGIGGRAAPPPAGAPAVLRIERTTVLIAAVSVDRRSSTGFGRAVVPDVYSTRATSPDTVAVARAVAPGARALQPIAGSTAMTERPAKTSRARESPSV